MKRNIFGILAIVIALSASAFTTSHKLAVKRTTNYKWFVISGSYAPAATVSPADAAYISGADGPDEPEEAEACSGTLKQCVSGFDPSKVTTGNMLNGPKAPDVHDSLRNQ